MAVSNDEFWQLLSQSRLIAGEQIPQLKSHFEQMPGADAKAIANGLMTAKQLSPYQASILLSGQPGPFFYGEYQVHDRITAGRFSGSFRALHVTTRHPVRLEFFTGSATKDPQTWSRIAQRGHAHCQISHPQLLAQYELVDLGPFKFLVLEDLAGRTLEDELSERQRLPIDEACRIVWLATLGLAQLHQSGLCHGDVRPKNVWIAGQEVKLIGDVTGRMIDDTSDVERLARADYAAPESSSSSEATAHSDVYALGCLLYELITGTVPFAGGDPLQKQSRHATEAIAPLGPHGVSDELARIVAYMMAKNSEVRFKDAGQVVTQLSPFVPDGGILPPSSVLPSQPLFENWVRQRQTMQTPPPAPPSAPLPTIATRPTISVGQPAPVAISAPAPTPASPTPIVQSVAGDHERTRLADIRRKNRRTQQLRIIVGGSFLAVVAISVAIGFVIQRGSVDPVVAQQNGERPEVPDVPPPPEDDPPNDPGPGDPPQNNEKYVLVADDGSQLWQSPPAGDPISFEYAPLGAQVFFFVRPADLLSAAEGPRVLRAMGPDFESLRERFETAAGVTFGEIQELIISLHDNDEGFPSAACVVHLRDSLNARDLEAKWPATTTVGEGDAQYLKSDDWCYWIPPAQEGRLFVMAPEAQIKDALELEGNAPEPRLQLARLRMTSNRQHHFTALFAPSYLFSEIFRDGRKLFFGDPRRVREPLQWLLADGLKACMFSIHLDDQFYWEMRAYGEANNDSYALASEFRNRLAEIPDRIEGYITQIDAPPYWRRIAFRYPAMVRDLHTFTRVGVEDEQAVINCRLPLSAAHNLVLGGELALVSPQGVAPPTPPTTVDVPASLVELLAVKMSLSFDQKSLEFAIADLATDIRDSYPNLPFSFDIVIIGKDLMDGGITRNQQVAEFNQADQPIADILTAIVRKANPTPVDDPTDEAQALVWVVGPDPNNPDNQIVLITTREAATSKQITLPEPFRPES